MTIETLFVSTLFATFLGLVAYRTTSWWLATREQSRYSFLTRGEELLIYMGYILLAAVGGFFISLGIHSLVEMYGILFIGVPVSSASMIGLYTSRTYLLKSVSSSIGYIKSIKAHKTQPTIEELDSMLRECKEIQESM